MLVALAEAKEAGFEVPREAVMKALIALKAMRNPDSSYLYGAHTKWRPTAPVNRPGGSMGRTHACNLALRMWEPSDVSQSVTREWLDRLIARNGWLSMGRKRPVPHESWFAVAGYYYYYGHYYAAETIRFLPEAEQPFYKHRLASIIMHHQEKDGSWWDYPLYDYHQAYGTALAIMTLRGCAVVPL